MTFDAKQYAKGCLLLPNHANVSVDALKKFDFAVIYGFKGATYRNDNAPKLMEVCKAAGIPVILLGESDPRPRVGWTLNEAVWPKGHSDPMVYQIDRLSFAGITPVKENKRYVHGLLLEMNIQLETSGRLMPDQWIFRTAQYVGDQQFDTAELPYWLSVNPDVLSKYAHSSGEDPFPAWLGNQSGISTYWKAPSIVAGQYDEVPLPTAADWDKLKAVRSESGLGFAKGIEFWCYSTGAALFDGITNESGRQVAVPLYLFMGSAESLYRMLQFTKTPTTPKPEDPKPEDPKPEEPEPTDPTTTKDLFWSAIIAAADAFTSVWAKGRSK